MIHKFISHMWHHCKFVRVYGCERGGGILFDCTIFSYSDISFVRLLFFSDFGVFHAKFLWFLICFVFYQRWIRIEFSNKWSQSSVTSFDILSTLWLKCCLIFHTRKKKFRKVLESLVRWVFNKEWETVCQGLRVKKSLAWRDLRKESMCWYNLGCTRCCWLRCGDWDK